MPAAVSPTAPIQVFKQSCCANLVPRFTTAEVGVDQFCQERESLAKDDPVLSSISRNVRDILFGELIFRNGPREILVRHDNDLSHASMTVGRKKLMDRKKTIHKSSSPSQRREEKRFIDVHRGSFLA